MNHEDFHVAKAIEKELSELNKEKENLTKRMGNVKELRLTNSMDHGYNFQSKCIDFNIIKTIVLSMIEGRIKELEKEFESL